MIIKKTEADPPGRPKIGVVLGSGGIKPLAAIALLDFLNESGIDIDLFIGCSGGSLISAGAALGYSSNEILEFYNSYFEKKPFSAVDYQTILGIANLPFGRFNLETGIVKSHKLLRFYEELYGDVNIEDLRIPTILQATDIQTGKGVILSSGKLAHAVYASTALYPFVPPIFFQQKWLVDGSLTSPLPLMEAVKRDMDIIIAVRFNEKNNPEPARFFDGFYNVISSFTRSLTQSQISTAIDFHHYEIIFLNIKFDKRIGVVDHNKMDEIINAGRKTVDLKKQEILEAINNFTKD